MSTRNKVQINKYIEWQRVTMSGTTSGNKGQRMTTSGTTIDNDNHSHCSHPSLKVVVYLFLSLNWWQSSILRSVLCCFHSLYNYSHSLSLIAIRCHSLLSLVVTLSLAVPRVVIRCHSLYHSLSLVVIRCHSLSLDVPLVCLFINDRK